MTTYTVNEAKLKRYSAHHPEPVITFKPRSTAVTIVVNDGLTIISDGVNIDEKVSIIVPGKRTFSGIVFNTDDASVEGIKDPSSLKYFNEFVKSMLEVFESHLCVCGGLLECYCDEGDDDHSGDVKADSEGQGVDPDHAS